MTSTQVASRLAVIIPSRGLMFSETLEDILRELEGLDYKIFWAHGKSLPDAFNDPTEEALADESIYALWFVEDDMILPKGILRKMFAKNYPVVALDYPFKQDGDSTVLHDPHGYAFWTGTGCLLVAREVLENMQKPIWRTDQTFDPFIDKDTIHFWPRALDKVYYGLHDLNFGLTLYSSGLPIMTMEDEGGQHKLAKLGTPKSNQGVHDIYDLTEVGKNVVSGLVTEENVNKFLGAMNRVKKVRFWEETPPFISYDEDNNTYLNDGRSFERVK